MCSECLKRLFLCMLCYVYVFGIGKEAETHNIIIYIHTHIDMKAELKGSLWHII